jgi:hypothetical protein
VTVVDTVEALPTNPLIVLVREVPATSVSALVMRVPSDVTEVDTVLALPTSPLIVLVRDVPATSVSAFEMRLVREVTEVESPLTVVARAVVVPVRASAADIRVPSEVTVVARDVPPVMLSAFEMRLVREVIELVCPPTVVESPLTMLDSVLLPVRPSAAVMRVLSVPTVVTSVDPPVSPLSAVTVVDTVEALPCRLEMAVLSPPVVMVKSLTETNWETSAELPETLSAAERRVERSPTVATMADAPMLSRMSVRVETRELVERERSRKPTTVDTSALEPLLSLSAMRVLTIEELPVTVESWETAVTRAEVPV